MDADVGVGKGIPIVFTFLVPSFFVEWFDGCEKEKLGHMQCWHPELSHVQTAAAII